MTHLNLIEKMQISYQRKNTYILNVSTKNSYLNQLKFLRDIFTWIVENRANIHL